MYRVISKASKIIGLTKYYPYQQTTFSQQGEDMVVNFVLRNHFKINKPSYLDIGAHHPYFLSNTAKLYISEGRGINIEPNPELYRLFNKHRSRDINLNVGISDKAGEADYYCMSIPTVNTFSKELAEYYQKEKNIRIVKIQKIRTLTVTNILREHNDDRMPDFLNIDVEGLDMLILKSIDFINHRPKVICIEANTLGDEQKTELLNFMTSKEYIQYAHNNINTIFIDNNI